MDGERVYPVSNFRFHNIVLEKVLLVFVVVFAFPVLGSHFPPLEKDTMFPAGRKVTERRGKCQRSEEGRSASSSPARSCFLMKMRWDGEKKGGVERRWRVKSLWSRTGEEGLVSGRSETADMCLSSDDWASRGVNAALNRVRVVCTASSTHASMLQTSWGSLSVVFPTIPR